MALNAKIRDFYRFLSVTQISRVNCAKIAGHRLEQPAYKIFSN